MTQSRTTAEIATLAEDVAQRLAETAVARDQRGGTAKIERDLLRASGLLTMSTPVAHGGWGAGWDTTQATVRTLARADGSLAHLFGFHHLMLATVRLFGARAQWVQAYEEAAQHAYFWGNALNPLDPRTTLAPASGGFVLNGGKSFCSGASDSDRLVVSALREGDGKLVIAALPTARAGITVHQDWDNMGQRQTDSGSVDFAGVHVGEDELLRTPGPLGSTWASLRPCIAQLILANVYLGLAEGAFAHARAYTRSQTRPRSTSAAAAGTVAGSDPYVLRDYGSMYVDLQGARLVTDAAGAALERAWQRGDELTPRERGETSIAVAAAKAATTRVGLDVSSRVFDVTSARATTRKDGFDRFWRNLRVHTLHDPVDYKLRELGEFALHDAIPTPSFYS